MFNPNIEFITIGCCDVKVQMSDYHYYKIMDVVEAAKAVWDADTFYEDENGREDTVPGELMLKLGDAVEALEQ